MEVQFQLMQDSGGGGSGCGGEVVVVVALRNVFLLLFELLVLFNFTSLIVCTLSTYNVNFAASHLPYQGPNLNCSEPRLS